MKKTKTISIIALILALTLIFPVGCGKTEDDSKTGNKSTVSDAQSSNGDATEGNDGTQATITDLTPAASYTRYLEAKTSAYDIIDEKISESDELALTVSMQLLAVTMVDLQALDLTFISDDEQACETAMSLLGITDGDINYSGENFGISYTNASGQKIVSNGKYDKSTDSLSCTWTTDGVETFIMEYVKYASGYAGQYYSPEDGTLIKIVVDGDSLAIGIEETAGTPSSIYNSAPSDMSFVDDCSEIFKIQDGQGTCVIDGEEKTF